ncbi:MAG: hypothetical protein ACN6O0_25840, partial [Achromobacter spanius]
MRRFARFARLDRLDRVDPVNRVDTVNRLNRFALSALLLAGLAWMPSLTAYAAPASGQPTPAAAATDAAHQAAMEGYLYFYPLVTMDLTRRQFTHPSQADK